MMTTRTRVVVGVGVASALAGAGCSDNGQPVLAPLTMPGQSIVLAPGARVELQIDTLMTKAKLPSLIPGGGSVPPESVPATKVTATSNASALVTATARGSVVDLVAIAPGTAAITVAGDYKRTRTSTTFTVEVKPISAVTYTVDIETPDFQRPTLRSGDRLTLARGLCYPVDVRPVLDGQDPRAAYPSLVTGDGVVSPGACEALSLFSATARTVEVGKVGSAPALTVEFVEPTFALRSSGAGFADLTATAPGGAPLALPASLFREARSATPAACVDPAPSSEPRFSFTADVHVTPTPAGGACEVTVEVAPTRRAAMASYTVTLPWPADAAAATSPAPATTTPAPKPKSKSRSTSATTP